MIIDYEEIARVHEPLAGWCELEKALDLVATVIALRPNVVVEIGVFGGRSLIPMALACKAIGKGRVIGIDPWSQQASAEGYTGENADWWKKLDHESVYQGFLGTLNRLNLQSIVEIKRSKSDDVAPPDVIDLLHVDGQHTEQALRDVNRFATNVRIGGFCFTDDDDWVDGGGGPQQAVKRLMELGFVPLYKCGTGTAFQRTR
jgi:hypothetical protein